MLGLLSESLTATIGGAHERAPCFQPSPARYQCQTMPQPSQFVSRASTSVVSSCRARKRGIADAATGRDLVVDDASTDGSGVFLEGFKRLHGDCIRLHLNERNLGVAADGTQPSALRVAPLSPSLTADAHFSRRNWRQKPDSSPPDPIWGSRSPITSSLMVSRGCFAAGPRHQQCQPVTFATLSSAARFQEQPCSGTSSSGGSWSMPLVNLMRACTCTRISTGVFDFPR